MVDEATPAAVAVASPTSAEAATPSGTNNDMSNGTTNNMKVILASPAALQGELPATEPVRRFVASSRSRIGRILTGKSNQLLAVVGPCSIHDPAAALEYARRLVEAMQQVRNEVFVVMRVYCEKPRTGTGWKGLIRDPFLDGSNDIGTGLLKARQLLLQLNVMGLPCACEFLDPLVPEYIGDLVSWGAIGARTAESQIHRELASGLPMPVGFKNSTNGSVLTALDGAVVASHPHSYIGINSDGHAAAMWTKGNHMCHIVLRGGHGGPNYHPHDIRAAVVAIRERAQATGLPLPIALVVDCSHANSGKDYKRQRTVIESIAKQLVEETHAHAIAGVMLESFIVEGHQPLKTKAELAYGKSITDACIDLAETAELLLTLAHAVRARRKQHREDSPAATASNPLKATRT